MRKWSFALVIVVALGVGASVVHSRGIAAPPDVAACKEGCSKDLQACLSQTPAADAEHERLRKNACNDRRIRCDKACEK